MDGVGYNNASRYSLKSAILTLFMPFQPSLGIFTCLIAIENLFALKVGLFRL